MEKRTKKRNNSRYSRKRVSRKRVSKKKNKRSRKIHKRKKMRGGMDKATANAIQESKICALIELGLDRVKAEELLGLPPSGPAPKPAKNISPEDAVQMFMSQTGVKEIDKAKQVADQKEYDERDIRSPSAR